MTRRHSSSGVTKAGAWRTSASGAWRRLAVALAALLLLAARWAAAPQPAAASCAGVATLRQISTEPGSAVFTGRATGMAPGGSDVVFVVDRWFHGPHAAQAVRLLGSTVVLAEPSAAAPANVVLATALSGEAVTLSVGEAVLMVATWDAADEAFGARPCSVAGVALASTPGRAAARNAVAVFGPGSPAAALPETDALAPSTVGDGAARTPVTEWWPLVIAFGFAFAAVAARGRRRGKRRGRPPSSRWPVSGG